MDHTELPWKVYYKTFRPQLSKMKIIEIQDAEGHPIVAWSGFDGVRTKTECLRNARFIVRACKNHYPLLNVLNRIIDDLPTNRDWLDPDLEKEAIGIVRAMGKRL